jgi:hypothetical protein
MIFKRVKNLNAENSVSSYYLERVMFCFLLLTQLSLYNCYVLYISGIISEYFSIYTDLLHCWIFLALRRLFIIAVVFKYRKKNSGGTIHNIAVLVESIKNC